MSTVSGMSWDVQAFLSVSGHDTGQGCGDEVSGP